MILNLLSLEREYFLKIKIQTTIKIYTGRSHFMQFFLHNFTSTCLKNLHHFFNLCDNFWFNAIWHRRSMATLVLYQRLSETDVTVMPSVTCTD